MATLEGGAAYGGGLVLGGAAVAGRVALPPLQVSGGALSVSAWVYLAGAADAFSLPLLELGAHGRALALGVHGATARVALRDGAGAAAQAVSWSLALAPNLMGPNAWHHIALVLDAPYLTLFVDGQAPPATLPPPPDPTSRHAPLASTSSQPSTSGGIWQAHSGGSENLGAFDLTALYNASSLGASALLCTLSTVDCGANATLYGEGRLKHVALYPSTALSPAEVAALHALGHAAPYAAPPPKHRRRPGRVPLPPPPTATAHPAPLHRLAPPRRRYPCLEAAEKPQLRYGYSRPNASYFNGEPIEPNVVCNYGGAARFDLEDASLLVGGTGMGFAFASDDGTLSGTPACPGNPAPCFAERQFIVTAYNRAGSDTATFKLKAPPPPPPRPRPSAPPPPRNLHPPPPTSLDHHRHRRRPPQVVHRPPKLGFYVDAAPTYAYGEPVANNTVPNSGGRDGLTFSIVNATPNGLAGGGSALPVGLVFSASDGTLYGTPVQGAPVAKYLVRAQNDGGASVTPLWLRVTEPPPNISLGFEPMVVRTSSDPLAYSVLQASAPGLQLQMSMGDALPNGRVPLRGTVDASTVFTVYPPFPTGLEIATDPSPALVGSPTSSTNNVTTWYTVRALTSSGTSYASLEISVLPPPPAIHGLVGGGALAAVVGLPIDEKPLNSSGGDGACGLTLLDNSRGWSNVPPGLAVHPTSGLLTGVPQYARDRYTYRLTCTNGGGSSSTDYTLAVASADPLDESVAVSLDASLLQAPLASLGREGLKAALLAHLEASLTSWSQALYSVAPFSCAGRVRLDCLRLDLSELFFTLRANATAAPTALDYTSARALMNELVSQLATSGSALTSPAASTGLPTAGLFTSPLRDGATGALAGDRAIQLLQTERTAADQSTILSAFEEWEVVYQVDQPVARNPIRLVGNDSSIAFYQSSPQLPAGLSLAGGAIEGTPTEEAARRLYKVKADNYRGQGEGKAYTKLYLSVKNAPPDLSPGYARPAAVYVAQATVLPNAVDFSNGGGKSTAETYAGDFFTVTPPLPAGLALDPDTGTISGAPLAASPATNYTVTASNFGGGAPETSSTTLRIEVLPGVPLDFATVPLSPTSGPLLGGTVLVLRTSGTEKTSSTPPRCSFGAGAEVVGAWLNVGDGTFQCVSPARGATGGFALTVALEGRAGQAAVLQADNHSQPVTFTYYDDEDSGNKITPTPRTLPTSGGTINIDWGNTINCPEPKPTKELTRLRVRDNAGLFTLEHANGCNVTNNCGQDCCFTCEVPAINHMQVKPRQVTFEVAMNGQQFHALAQTSQLFDYTEETTPVLNSVEPALIAVGLSYTLKLKGSQYQPDTTGACVFNASCAGGGHWGGGELSFASTINQETSIDCPMPAAMLALTADCNISARVRNTGNTGVDRLSGSQDVGLFELPSLTSVRPLYAPFNGGTTVTLSGVGLQQGAGITWGTTATSHIKVRFGDSKEVDGTRQPDGTVTAVSPTGFTSSGNVELQVALNGLQYSTNGTTLRTFGIKSIQPRSLPAGRSVNLTVTLAGLSEAAVQETTGWRCLFGNDTAATAVAVVATPFDPVAKTLVCASPAGAANTTDNVFVAALDSSATEVATQATVEYYRPFTLLSLSRLSGPKGGGAAGPIEVEVEADHLDETTDGVFCACKGNVRAGRLREPFDGRTAVCTVPTGTAGLVSLALSLTRTDQLDAAYGLGTVAPYFVGGNATLFETYAEGHAHVQYVAYGLKRLSPTNSPADRDANLTFEIDGFTGTTPVRQPAAGRCRLTTSETAGYTVQLVLDGHMETTAQQTAMGCPVPFGGCRYHHVPGAANMSATAVPGQVCAAPGVATCTETVSGTCAAALSAEGAWPSQSAKTALVAEVAMEDSVDFTSSGQAFTLYPPLVLTSSTPPWGPMQGGFYFFANGTGFDEVPPESSVWCRFTRNASGDNAVVRVNGALEGTPPHGVACQVPNLNRAAAYTVEVSLNDAENEGTFSRSDPPVAFRLYDLAQANPQSGPVGVATAVELTMTTTWLPGNELPPSLLCKFACAGNESVLSATWQNGNFACASPLVDAPCPNGSLAIAQLDEPLFYTAAVGFQQYAAPTAAALSPSVGPSGGGFSVTVLGTNLIAEPYGVPQCKFGGSNPQQVDEPQTASRISCPMPQLSPRQHALELSLNSFADAHATSLEVTVFTIGSRVPVSVPLNVSRVATLTINGFPTAATNADSLEQRLMSQRAALLCRFAPVNSSDSSQTLSTGENMDCGGGSTLQLANWTQGTDVECPAPTLVALSAANTEGACEVSIEAAILEGEQATLVYSLAALRPAGADLTADLMGGGVYDVSNHTYFTTSGLKIWCAAFAPCPPPPSARPRPLSPTNVTPCTTPPLLLAVRQVL